MCTDIKYNKERNTAIFYTCGVCNLQCRYCGIDKNPILKTIDEALGKSFEGDYYIERLKQYFSKGQLKRVETWGGEPFLHMDRIYPLVNQIIEYFPYFSEMYSSTNFSYPQWLDQVFGLFDQFGKYPYRKFNYQLQLSVDGPKEINDAGRGQGVTERCLENYHKLIDALKDNRLPANVHLDICLKPTLDNDTIRRICSKEKIIEYYQFFETEFLELAQNIPNVTIYPPIPNTAVPSPVTVEEGKIFAELCRLCREIEKENITYKYFKYYKEITPFTSDITQDALTYRYNYHTCGTGNSMIGFLPDNMISICHEGFTQFVEEYKRMAAKSTRDNTSTITFSNFLGDTDNSVNLCVDDCGYAKHEKHMSYFNTEGTSSRLSSITSLIMTLAMAGQIEPCFAIEENALKGAIFIQCHTSFCVKDNLNKTGSISNVPVGLIKLLLNGAMKYIQHDGELEVL